MKPLEILRGHKMVIRSAMKLLLEVVSPDSLFIEEEIISPLLITIFADIFFELGILYPFV